MRKTRIAVTLLSAVLISSAAHAGGRYGNWGSKGATITGRTYCSVLHVQQMIANSTAETFSTANGIGRYRVTFRRDGTYVQEFLSTKLNFQTDAIYSIFDIANSNPADDVVGEYEQSRKRVDLNLPGLVDSDVTLYASADGSVLNGTVVRNFSFPESPEQTIGQTFQWVLTEGNDCAIDVEEVP